MGHIRPPGRWPSPPALFPREATNHHGPTPGPQQRHRPRRVRRRGLHRPRPVQLRVDTVGAGDSFTAGLLHRLAALGHLGGRLDALSLEDVTDSCSFAAHVAAVTCSVHGANPPWVDEAAMEAGVEQLLPHA
ncbi:PfkB family carbohydrate kinase [Streptomyces sp. P9-A2]